jgi:ABC-type maltose transport system permease subunit
VVQFIWLRVNHPLVHALTAVFAAGAVLFALPLWQ